MGKHPPAVHVGDTAAGQEHGPLGALHASPRAKADLMARLDRIEGQIRGLKRMIESDRYCVDILVQIAAVRAALNQVGLSLLDAHTRGCVSNAIRQGSADAAIDELIEAVGRFVKS